MTDVIAGQSITLLAQFYDFEGGTLTDLDATPTIQITSVATGEAALTATSTGVTHPGTGSYGYTWTPSIGLAPGLYLATWTGQSAGDPVTATETFTVIAAVSGRVYATSLQYEAYTGQTAPTGITAQLAKASRYLDGNVFKLCWYEVDASGFPSNPLVRQAFADAACAQAAWWDELGDSTGAGTAGWGSVSLGSAQLSRSVTNVSGNASAAREIAPEVIDVLSSPDLTPDIFRLGSVVDW
jgi:hypothetical protein